MKDFLASHTDPALIWAGHFHRRFGYTIFSLRYALTRTELVRLRRTFHSCADVPPDLPPLFATVSEFFWTFLCHLPPGLWSYMDVSRVTYTICTHFSLLLPHLDSWVSSLNLPHRTGFFTSSFSFCTHRFTTAFFSGLLFSYLVHRSGRSGWTCCLTHRHCGSHLYLHQQRCCASRTRLCPRCYLCTPRHHARLTADIVRSYLHTYTDSLHYQTRFHKPLRLFPHLPFRIFYAFAFLDTDTSYELPSTDCFTVFPSLPSLYSSPIAGLRVYTIPVCVCCVLRSHFLADTTFSGRSRLPAGCWLRAVRTDTAPFTAHALRLRAQGCGFTFSLRGLDHTRYSLSRLRFTTGCYTWIVPRSLPSTVTHRTTLPFPPTLSPGSGHIRFSRTISTLPLHLPHTCHTVTWFAWLYVATHLVSCTFRHARHCPPSRNRTWPLHTRILSRRTIIHLTAVWLLMDGLVRLFTRSFRRTFGSRSDVHGCCGFRPGFTYGYTSARLPVGYSARPSDVAAHLFYAHMPFSRSSRCAVYTRITGRYTVTSSFAFHVHTPFTPGSLDYTSLIFSTVFIFHRFWLQDATVAPRTFRTLLRGYHAVHWFWTHSSLDRFMPLVPWDFCSLSFLRFSGLIA